MCNKKPNVLCIAGHDPTGGAGIQADIETANSMGCHACSIVTTLTAQDTRDVMKIRPIEVDLIKQQLHILCEDIRIDAVKIGLLGSASTARLVAQFLQGLNAIPIVIDPVLAAGGGAVLANPELTTVICQELLPLATVLTPNSLEARQLASEDGDLDQCAQTLLSYGCQCVLITGTHEPDDDVSNLLYDQSGLLKDYHWTRLDAEYHGSGCTLSTAIAAQLALGETLTDAVESAQQYTWNSLNSGYQPGRHQYVPNRLP